MLSGLYFYFYCETLTGVVQSWEQNIFSWSLSPLAPVSGADIEMKELWEMIPETWSRLWLLGSVEKWWWRTEKCVFMTCCDGQSGAGAPCPGSSSVRWLCCWMTAKNRAKITRNWSWGTTSTLPKTQSPPSLESEDGDLIFYFILKIFESVQLKESINWERERLHLFLAKSLRKPRQHFSGFHRTK